MPKKDEVAEKINSLQQSVTQIERHLSSEVATQREEVEGIRTRLENDIKKLQADQGKLTKDIGVLPDSAQFKKVQDDQNNLQGEIGKTEERLDELTKGIQDVAQEMGKVQSELFAELKLSHDRIAELEARPIPRDSQLEKELSDMIHNLKSWTENQLTQSSETLSKEVDRLSQTIWPFVVGTSVELDRRIGGLQAEVDNNVTAKLKDVDSRLEKDMASLRADLLSGTRRRSQELSSQLDGQICRLTAQLEDMTKDIESCRETVGGFGTALNGTHTRSATWKIHGFRQKLFRILQQRDLVLTSPSFTLCGQPDITLEMLAAPQEESELPVPVPPIPVPGSCSIRIWAQPGLHLVFKLTLGEGSAFSRRFEHDFKVEEVMDSRGRSSFQMPNLCQLDDIWVKKSNTVRVRIDLLELRYETVDVHPNGIAGADDVKDIVPYAGREGDTRASLTEMDEETKDATLAAMVGKQDEEITDELSTARYLVSDQVLQEMLKGELQTVRNKSVRRVEWRLEGASRLLEMIRAGEAVDSSIFSAAGVDQMQLHFYPRGCDLSEKVSANAQACSIYLSGPQRTTIRGTLFVGSHARQFEHRYQLKGDRGGRERFCKLDSMLDAEDSVTLAVEIAEVESDIPDKASNLLWRNYSGPAKDLNPLHAIPFGVAVGGGAKGILRMKREDPNKVEEVVRCMSLPTLNTRAHFLPQIPGQRKGR